LRAAYALCAYAAIEKSNRRKTEQINVCVNVRKCVYNNGQPHAVSKCRFKPMNALAFE